MIRFSLLSKWFNAVADAWNRGEAPWAYDDKGRSVAVKTWNERGDGGFVAWCMEQGITLKRQR